jgi:Phospholipase_D-nuclease N-terminal
MRCRGAEGAPPPISLSIVNRVVRNCACDQSAWTNGHALKWSRCRSRGDPEMMYGYNSLWGLLVLAGDIWAIINIVQSSASNERKLIWILVVLVLPLLGLILWYFLGPRDGRV